jgi:hypothetical protein
MASIVMRVSRQTTEGSRSEVAVPVGSVLHDDADLVRVLHDFDQADEVLVRHLKSEQRQFS